MKLKNELFLTGRSDIIIISVITSFLEFGVSQPVGDSTHVFDPSVKPGIDVDIEIRHLSPSYNNLNFIEPHAVCTSLLKSNSLLYALLY